jgi:hypothetical protein
MDIFIAQMQFLQLDECILLQYTEYQYHVVVVFCNCFCTTAIFPNCSSKEKSQSNRIIVLQRVLFHYSRILKTIRIIK